MTFSLTAETDNAAFGDDPGPEMARILRAAADRIEGGYAPESSVVFADERVEPVAVVDHGMQFALTDINGNAVGYVRWVHESTGQTD